MKYPDWLIRLTNAFGALAAASLLVLIADFAVHLWTAYHGRVDTSSIFGG
jgi:hypothetical protein